MLLQQLCSSIFNSIYRQILKLIYLLVGNVEVLSLFFSLPTLLCMLLYGMYARPPREGEEGTICTGPLACGGPKSLIGTKNNSNTTGAVKMGWGTRLKIFPQAPKIVWVALNIQIHIWKTFAIFMCFPFYFIQ